ADSGVNWTARENNRNWYALASSADGSRLFAAEFNGQIYTSTDSGVNWTARENGRSWQDIATSADGTKLVAAVRGGQIYTSSDSGVNWTARENSRNWWGVTCSADGSKLAAVVSNGQIYTSTDFGVTWTARENNRDWYCVTSSADGSKLVAGVQNGQIYTSFANATPHTIIVAANASAQTTSAFGTSISAGPNESAQTVSFVVTNSNNALFTVQPAISSTGTLTYTLSPTASGSADVSVTAQDNGGTANGGVDSTAAQTFRITVTPVNNPPVVTFAQSTVTRLEDSGAHSAASFASFSPGPASESAQTLLGYTVTNNNNTLFSAQPAINNSGALTFTPLANAFGSATVSVSVQDSGGTANGGVDTSTTTFTIAITSVNDAPSFALPAGMNIPAGQTWTARETNRDWRSLASSADGTKLAAVTSGLLFTSTDAGATWVQRSVPVSHAYVASSADGTKLLTTAYGGRLYTSTDSGVSWTARENSRNWANVVSSADGTKLAALVRSGQIYTSADSGVNWTARENNRNWYALASSADGSRLIAAEFNGQIYTSTDSGVSWTARENGRSWQDIASSADGTKLVAAVRGGQIYLSTDSGVTWTARESSRNWSGVASSADGSKLVAVVSNGQIYISNDSGLSWIARESSRDWACVTSSSDGGKLVAAVSNGQLYTSEGPVPPIHTVAANAGAQSNTALVTSISPGPTNESSQTVSFNVTNSNNALFTVQPAISSTGVLTYTPSPTAGGSADVSIVIQDNGGTANGGQDSSVVQTLRITITPINQPPVVTLAQSTVTRLEDSGAHSAASFAAFSPGPASESAQTLLGYTVTNNNNTLFSAQPAINNSGTLTFTPAANAFGTATISVVARDSGGTANGGVDTTTTTFTIAITGVNDAPSFVTNTSVLGTGGMDLVVWGSNSHGQRNVPGGLGKLRAAGVGQFHALAVKMDGTVVAWGNNAQGQCNVPGGLSGVIAVAGGDYHSLALKADGTVVAWGTNNHGVGNVPVGSQ
ncbi:MAG: Ig-like domain-containing protein, partial [Verrucomicrobia bacterium]|nr:Ig-like domain-containing protein [Verrucomicrobiota bacterium]